MPASLPISCKHIEMAMADKIFLLILFVITVAEAAPPLPAELTNANKSIADLHKKMHEAFNGVNAAATPDKKKKVEAATLAKSLLATVILEEAKHAGDEKKVVNIARSYEKAADMVIAAPPAEKLKVMEEAFNAAVAPDPSGCPTVDKSFCEASSKFQKVYKKVSTLIDATPQAKMVEMKDVASNQKFVMDTSINDAYATGDKKKIAEILAAYSKAADVVIAAAPAETLKVMEEAFTAAAIPPVA